MHHGRCFPALLRAYRQTQRRVNDKKNYSSSSSPSSLQIRRSIYSLSPSVNSGVRGMEYVAMANKQDFYHLFITPHKSCISSKMLDITGFFALFVQSELPLVLKISSRIFSGFLMFFPAILVKALVKKVALPTGNFKRSPHAAVHLWHHQTSHGCRYSALR